MTEIRPGQLYKLRHPSPGAQERFRYRVKSARGDRVKFESVETVGPFRPLRFNWDAEKFLEMFMLANDEFARAGE